MRPTVLVVDDEPLNRTLMRASIAGFCEVIEAESGPAALAQLEARQVDLVLLDVMMPRMDGYEVCRRIKEKAGDFLPVLLVTALGDQVDRNRGLEAGANDFLTKPVDRRELVLRTQAFLRLREQDRVIRRQVEELRRLQATQDELVALLVHDLRSPLAGVIAHLQLLAEELAGRQAADAQQAMRGAQTALQRLEEVLQVRLIEEGRLPLRRAPVSLEVLVRETLTLLEPVARRRNVRLDSIVEGQPVARLDGGLVRRSLENMLTNALKYTPAGSDVAIAVRSGPEQVVVEVADRGVGVPDELKATLFEKFGSVEAKRGGHRKGIGLGLYLVKLVAQGHGGTVSVEDRAGGGSVFRLALGAG